jgi:SRSO17 transposase
MFKLTRIPPIVDRLLAELELYFTVTEWLHFRSMLVALLVTTYKATVSGRMHILAFGTHRTKHNEFLHKADVLLEKVLALYALCILRLLYVPEETVYVIIDDSKNKKRGKKINSAAKFFDHTTKRYIWAHQFVCCIFVYRGVVIPYAIRLFTKEEECKKLGIPFKKLTVLAREMLESITPFQKMSVCVLADCFYASAPIVKTCKAKHFAFASVLKSNRNISIDGYRTKVGRFIANGFKKAKKQTIWIDGVCYKAVKRQVYVPKIGQVAVLFSKHKKHRKVLALFTTETNWSARKMIATYRLRWTIEVFFKTTKQYLGLNAYQHTDYSAVVAHLHLSLLAHALLTHLFITEQSEKGNLTTKKLHHFSVRDTQQRLRYLAALDTFDAFTEHKHQSLSIEDVNKLKNLLLAA